MIFGKMSTLVCAAIALFLVFLFPSTMSSNWILVMLFLTTLPLFANLLAGNKAGILISFTLIFYPFCIWVYALFTRITQRPEELYTGPFWWAVLFTWVAPVFIALVTSLFAVLAFRRVSRFFP